MGVGKGRRIRDLVIDIEGEVLGVQKKRVWRQFLVLPRLPTMDIFIIKIIDKELSISNVRKIILCKKIYHDVVLHVPNFQLSAKSFSFFSAFFTGI